VKQREFIAGLAGVAAWPLAAGAQPSVMPLVAYIGAGTPDTSSRVLAGFRKGVGEIGYAEGQNATVEYNWMEGR
jgi:putative tryptophan/tyrosine transport system substrate-binding protein